MSLGLDLAELSKHLRQERLFVTSERDQLLQLYEQVKNSGEQLFHQSWIGQQQKVVLDQLISASTQVMPAECCTLTNQLEATVFEDGYKQLSYHASKYGEFLKFLLDNPSFVGQILAAADQNNVASVGDVIKTLIHSVYANCILQEDEISMLYVLKSLLELQLSPCENPRRMLSRGSCAFSMAFKQLFDMVFSSKLFLTAALHDPVMRLLMEDEWFYDIDPGKALVRFPPSERLRRFGEPGTEQYKDKLAKYRITIVDKLVLMANRFITSIKNNMHCFPPGLGWLVSQLYRMLVETMHVKMGEVYQMLVKTGRVEMDEVRAVCADLVFAQFICPAVCDPEPHGITTDVPISHIARHNLIQMAQILQVLAISQWEKIDSRVMDLYGKFEKGCMSTLLDSLLDGIGVELPTAPSTQQTCLTRTATLIPNSRLNQLVTFLRSALPSVEDSPERKVLEELLSGMGPVTPSPSLGHLNVQATPPDTPTTAKKLKGKKKMSTVSMMTTMSDETASVNSLTLDPEAQPSGPEEVLVIPLGNDPECPGMMSEQKVLVCEQETKRRRVKYQTVQWEYQDQGEPPESQEKRTRFSLSQDQESIGNTSDIPEGLSEDASSHSVGSQDLENDDDNDNFSDMISANVSGRGTPNISGSGRETPLSQIMTHLSVQEEEEEERVPYVQPALPETVQKKNREDVTDKFGKFDIKPELDYDLKSTVSDTWSTDVLASDSEPPEMPQQVRLEEIAEEMVRQQFLTSGERVLGLSKAPSDAWSTDVMPSDTEDKQAETFSEFDDMSSMAEPGGSNLDDVRSEPGGSNLDDLRSEPEVGMINENPPIASGYVSVNQLPGGAMGGTSVTSDNVSMSPTFSDSVFSDIDDNRLLRDSRPNRGLRENLPGTSLDSNKLFVPIKKKRGQSPSGSSPDRNSDTSSNRYRLVDFAPEPKDSSFSSHPVIDTSIMNGTRPKVVPSERKNHKITPYEKFKENTSAAEVNFVIGDEKRPISNDSGVCSANFTENAMDLQLSEQQNSNVDEARFSAALSLFDPLADSSNATGEDLLEGPGSPRTNSTIFFSNPNFITNANTRTSNAVVEQNAEEKPKTNDFQLVTPLYDVSQSATSSSTQVFLNSSVSAGKPRRASTDSNRSSGSSLSKDGSNSDERLVNLNSETPSRKENSMKTEVTASGKKKGLFRTFKEKINKGRKKKETTNHGKETTNHGKEDTMQAESTNTLVEVDGAIALPTPAQAAEPNIIITETSDDILAKYRKKSILTSTPTCEPAQQTDKERRRTLKENSDSMPLYDSANPEKCLAFLDAKRKLRIVLGSADFQIGYHMSSVMYSPREGDSRPDNNDLVSLLRTQLSEAINLQNKDAIAQLHEALRCVRQFDNEVCKKIVRSLQDEYKGRSSYISYLVRCKQGLLSTLAHIRTLQNRVNREKAIYSGHMTSVCVRLFVEHWEKALQGFILQFQRQTVSDEKTDLLERFLQDLYSKMDSDAIWKAATEMQIDDARLAIERFIMSRIYTHAMFPNGDGDIHRDQLIQQHIRELSKSISPDHQDLKIPKMYHLECPWPAAQRELYMINAYKTPRDKVKCIHRCASTIMNLLSMANEKSVPAADDFTPVFIFIIIKANPPCLLSTIQYVNSLYHERLHGEEQYWWMQFVAAVEFIKTMDYPRDSQA